jgi:hypothetical protein
MTIADTGEGVALRAALPAHDKREILRNARHVTSGLWEALDHLDNLAEQPEVLTPSEVQAVHAARVHVVAAFTALKQGAPDLTGLVPVNWVTGQREQG